MNLNTNRPKKRNEMFVDSWFKLIKIDFFFLSTRGNFELTIDIYTYE